VVNTLPAAVAYGATFKIATTTMVIGLAHLILLAPGFHTHGVGMEQRMLKDAGASSAEFGTMDYDGSA
jgi:hypothetical protein